MFVNKINKCTLSGPLISHISCRTISMERMKSTQRGTTFNWTCAARVQVEWYVPRAQLAASSALFEWHLATDFIYFFFRCTSCALCMLLEDVGWAMGIACSEMTCFRFLFRVFLLLLFLFRFHFHFFAVARFNKRSRVIWERDGAVFMVIVQLCTIVFFRQFLA